MAKIRAWYTKRKQFTAKTGKKRKTNVYYLFQGSRTPISTGQETKEAADAWARAYLNGSSTSKFDVVRQQKRPLTEHLDEFEQTRLNGHSTNWDRMLVTRIHNLIKWCGWHSILDLDASRLKQVLARRDMAVRTRSHYIQAAKQFGNWLVANNRADSNPFLRRDHSGRPILVGRMPRESEKTRRRRYLSVDEVRHVIEAAETGPTLQGVSGPDRAMAIRLAVTTGLRRSELGSVTRQSFDFAGNPPTVYVLPDSTKNRDGAELPLRGDVIDDLQEWLETKSNAAPDEPIFGIFGKRTAEMLRADFTRCTPEIPYVDQRGRVADWHALRATFASLLILAGNPLVTVQKLMRHSTPELTANLYAQLGLEDFSEAVETLPRI